MSGEHCFCWTENWLVNCGKCLPPLLTSLTCWTTLRVFGLLAQVRSRCDWNKMPWPTAHPEFLFAFWWWREVHLFFWDACLILRRNCNFKVGCLILASTCDWVLDVFHATCDKMGSWFHTLPLFHLVFPFRFSFPFVPFQAGHISESTSSFSMTSSFPL